MKTRNIILFVVAVILMAACAVLEALGVESLIRYITLGVTGLYALGCLVYFALIKDKKEIE